MMPKAWFLMVRLGQVLAVSIFLWPPIAAAQNPRSYALPDGAAPVDLAIDATGAIWFASRSSGALGRLDPQSGETSFLTLGHGAQPATLVLGPDGNLFATDAVANTIYRVDPVSHDVLRFPIDGPSGPLELNGAAFDHQDRLWFTAYSGYFGWLEPRTGRSVVLPAPGGRGPAGVVSDGGNVWFMSYTSESLIRADPDTLRTQVFALPTGYEGPRSLAITSDGGVWLTTYQSGALLRLDARLGEWSVWPLPGAEPRPLALAVDLKDNLWMSDIGQSLLLTFDPTMQMFTQSVTLGRGCMARSVLPSAGNIWVAETRCDSIRSLDTAAPVVTGDR